MAPLATESLFWIAAAACAVAQAAILRAVVRGNSQATQGSLGAQSEGATPRRAPRRVSEAAWALLPGIALAFVLVWTWHAVHQGHHTSSPTATQPLLSPVSGA